MYARGAHTAAEGGGTPVGHFIGECRRRGAGAQARPGGTVMEALHDFVCSFPMPDREIPCSKMTRSFVEQSVLNHPPRSDAPDKQTGSCRSAATPHHGGSRRPSPAPRWGRLAAMRRQDGNSLAKQQPGVFLVHGPAALAICAVVPMVAA